MPKFIVQVMIREAYEVEAEDARDAEQKLRSNHDEYRSGISEMWPTGRLRDNYKGYYADVKPPNTLGVYPIQFYGASFVQEEAIPTEDPEKVGA